MDIIRFLSNPEASEAWQKRSEDPGYAPYISKKRYEELDKRLRPYGVLTGGYRLDTPGWVNAARNFLKEKDLLHSGFEPITEAFVEPESIIYATGAVGKTVSNGIIPNKGEALIVKIPGWSMPGIVKEKVYFIPLKEKDMFWVGSYYHPWPEDADPSTDGKEILLTAISEVYPGDVELVDHLTGIRPTVDDRRPLVGPYPEHPGTYLFNGMGTKGTSLAPYWAGQLVTHLVDGSSLPAIVNPARYSTVTG